MWTGIKVDHDFLIDVLTGNDLDGEGQRNRRAVSLERCIGPIAVIFHLEDFAIEANTRVASTGELVGDGSNIHEGLVRGDFCG